MKLLCKSEGHGEGSWEELGGKDAAWCARGGREREVQGPRLVLEVNSSNHPQPALNNSDQLDHGSVFPLEKHFPNKDCYKERTPLPQPRSSLPKYQNRRKETK